MTDLQGKVALITGSARGIGRAIALRYAALGAHIVVNYSRDGAAANATVSAAQAAGAEAIAVRCDVSVVADLDALFRAGLERFGRLDIVVANAGVEIVNQPIVEVTEEQFDRLFAINTKGAFFTMQKAAQHVADGGRLIYVGSTTTHGAFPGAGMYGCSKMAPQYLVDVLAMEIGARGVTVNRSRPRRSTVLACSPNPAPMIRSGNRSPRPVQSETGWARPMMSLMLPNTLPARLPAGSADSTC
jgi:3-oxoacyl-[acyl-carrier protein] reductase